MQIKIKENAEEIYINRQVTNRHPVNWEWAHKLTLIQGMILDVETEFLFRDQFNTMPIDGVSDLGMRIMVQSVEYVLNDERHGKMRCEWCGKCSEQSDKCPHCGNDEYIKYFYIFDDHNPVCMMVNPRDWDKVTS